MRRLNLADVALEEGPGRDGFWLRGAPLGASLGAARIGAGLYEARAGTPIWPYHYHYPDEEWLLVLKGAPVLRESGGRRALRGGDVVCFPAGHRGAHTVEGPGRFLIFSTRRAEGPFVSVYPDSDKVSVFPGFESGALNAMRLPRDACVDYWHGEGSGAVPESPATREPADVPARPVVNLDEIPLGAADAVDGRRLGALGTLIGGHGLDGALLELDPGADFGPYRYEHGREQWLLVLSGAPALQHAEGTATLRARDVVCLPDGPAGGRRPFNPPGAEPARVLLLWSTGVPAAVCYPATGEWLLRTERDAPEIPLSVRSS